MGRETKGRIVAEAARLFDEQGFAATGVAAILRAAGVNSGSLYHFFDSKNALLTAVLERHLERLGPTILEPVEAAAIDPLERVLVLLDLYRRDLLASTYSRGCPVGSLFSAASISAHDGARQRWSLPSQLQAASHLPSGEKTTIKNREPSPESVISSR